MLIPNMSAMLDDADSPVLVLQSRIPAIRSCSYISSDFAVRIFLIKL